MPQEKDYQALEIKDFLQLWIIKAIPHAENANRFQLWDDLYRGVGLCRVLETVYPGTPISYLDSPAEALTNIEEFKIKFCALTGFPATETFDSDALLRRESQAEEGLIKCLVTLYLFHHQKSSLDDSDPQVQSTKTWLERHSGIRYENLTPPEPGTQNESTASLNKLNSRISRKIDTMINDQLAKKSPNLMKWLSQGSSSSNSIANMPEASDARSDQGDIRKSLNTDRPASADASRIKKAQASKTDMTSSKAEIDAPAADTAASSVAFLNEALSAYSSNPDISQKKAAKVSKLRNPVMLKRSSSHSKDISSSSHSNPALLSAQSESFKPNEAGPKVPLLSHLHSERKSSLSNILNEIQPDSPVAEKIDSCLDAVKLAQEHFNHMARDSVGTIARLKMTLQELQDASKWKSQSSEQQGKALLARNEDILRTLSSRFDAISRKLEELNKNQDEILDKLSSESAEKIRAHKTVVLMSNADRFSVAKKFEAGNASDAPKSSKETEIASPPSNDGPKPPPVSNALAKLLPPEVLNAGLPKSDVMRLATIYELLETEADYVRDLRTIITFHKEQFLATKLMNKTQVDEIFSNVAELVDVNQRFLELLKVKRQETMFIDIVGDAFMQVSDSFKAYITYCSNYPNALEISRKIHANPAYKEHIDRWTVSPETRGLSLDSFLIKPVQRICKYPLLLRELKKFTSKNSKDSIYLQMAMEKIENVVAVVNESTKRLGEKDRILQLQQKLSNFANFPLDISDKKLVKEGLVGQIFEKKLRDRILVLLNDTILICGDIEGTYELESFHSLFDYQLEMQVKDPSLSRYAKTGVQLSQIGKKDALIFNFANEEERAQWQKILQATFKPIEEERKLYGKTGKTVENNLNISEMTGSSEYAIDHQIWKKAHAVTGQTYFFNKETLEVRWNINTVEEPRASKVTVLANYA